MMKTKRYIPPATIRKVTDLLLAIPEPDRDAFSSRCGSTWRHIRHIGLGYKPCSPALAVGMEREFGSRITRPELRPDDWASIWPELIADIRAAA